MFTNFWKTNAPLTDKADGKSPKDCCQRRAEQPLAIESLELRACPAIAVFAVDDALTIRGDAHDDLIVIEDYGGGLLNVNGTDYTGIDRITMTTLSGNDQVNFSASGTLSLSRIDLHLGRGDDVANFDFGRVEQDAGFTVFGGFGDDQISAAVDEVFADATTELRMYGGFGSDELSTTIGQILDDGVAHSRMAGGLGNDVIRCQQNNIAGSATCVSVGGFGDDQIFCEKSNILEGAEAICRSWGGEGDDTILCTELHIAGHSACISDGGLGSDIVSCTLIEMEETGSALCEQSGGAGDDTLICDKVNVRGTHVCFADGGSGNDTMYWIARGNDNSGDFQCTMLGGRGDDSINVQVFDVIDGSIVPTEFTGMVDYSAEGGPGNDTWNATTYFTPDSNGIFTSIRVLLGTGDDTAGLFFVVLGNTLAPNAIYSGGSGEDTYIGPPPEAFVPLQFPAEKFENFQFLVPA